MIYVRLNKWGNVNDEGRKQNKTLEKKTKKKKINNYYLDYIAKYKRNRETKFSLDLCILTGLVYSTLIKTII